MSKRIALILATCIVFASCTDVLLVKVSDCLDDKEGRCSDKEIDYRKVPGIPFYGRKAQLKQTTVYAKTWLKLTLAVESRVFRQDAGASNPSKVIFERPLEKRHMPQLDQIRIAIIHGPSDSIEAALDVIKSFQDLPEITDDTGVQEVMLKNTVETEWIVDKDHKYYLNAPLPWFGSGSLTQELNPDGTLAKATSTADTKLADGISSFIPFKEYLSGRFVKVFDDKDEENKTDASILLADNTQALKMIGQKGQNNFIVTLSLNIEEVGHEYTFTRVAETKSELQSNISFDTENNSFSRNSIGFLVQAAIETDDGTLVGITGSIKFPKDWGVPKPADPKAP